jgi:hypothetical protein
MGSFYTSVIILLIPSLLTYNRMKSVLGNGNLIINRFLHIDDFLGIPFLEQRHQGRNHSMHTDYIDIE